MKEKIARLIGSDVDMKWNKEDDYITLYAYYNLSDEEHFAKIGVYSDKDENDCYNNLELDRFGCTFTDLPITVDENDLYTLMYDYVKQFANHPDLKKIDTVYN